MLSSPVAAAGVQALVNIKLDKITNWLLMPPSVSQGQISPRLNDSLVSYLPFTFCAGASDGKAFAYNAEDPGSIPGSGRSPGEGNSNPLQYSCLENPMDRGAW